MEAFQISAFVEAAMAGNRKKASAVLQSVKSPDAQKQLIDANCPIMQFAASHAAARFGRLRFLQWLVSDLRCDLEVRCEKYDATPIFYAAGAGRTQCVRFLLDAGTQCATHDAQNRKPIDWALDQKRECYFLFLEKSDPPMNFTLVEAGKEYLQVSFDSPADNGGLDIFEYVAYCRFVWKLIPRLASDPDEEGEHRDVKAIEEEIVFKKAIAPGEGAQAGFAQSITRLALEDGSCDPLHLDIIGLRPGCVYLVAIAAVTKLGEGVFTDWKKMTTLPTEPSPPPQPKPLTTTSQRVVVSWEMPADQGGARLTYFEVAKRRAAGGVFKTFAQVHCGPRATLSAAVDGLKPGEAFRFRVRAKNRVGFSLWSQESNVVRTNAAAELLSRGPRDLRLSWVAPYLGGSRYAGAYEIQRRKIRTRKEKLRQSHLSALGEVFEPEAAGEWIPSGFSSTDDGPTAVISELHPNTRYCFRIRPLSEPVLRWDESIESPAFSTEVDAPDAPWQLSCIATTHSSLCIKWKKGLENGLPTEAFEIRAKELDSEAAIFARVGEGEAQGFVPLESRVIGLKAHAQYHVAVRGQNEVGWGPWSYPLAVWTRSLAAPEPPVTCEEIVSGDTFIKVKWESRSADEVDAYMLQFSTDYLESKHGPTHYPGIWHPANTNDGQCNENEMIVSGLKPVRQYFFRLALRSACFGDWSDFSFPSKAWTSQRRW